MAASSAGSSDLCLYDFAAPETMPASGIDPFAPDWLYDPYQGYEMLREAGQLVWLTAYNVVGAARFEEVRAILNDWRSFSSARGVGIEDFERHGRFRLPSVILETDPPDHDLARSVLAKALSPARMRQIKDRVEVVANQLIVEAVAKKEIDGVAEIAEALPMAVFPDLIGIPQEGRARLLPHADWMFNSFGPRNELYKASIPNTASDWVEALGRLENLAPDGLGADIHRLAAEAGFDQDMAGKLVRALLQAGLDTTINGIGATLYCLSRNPGQWRLLKGKPALAAPAFEEAIRLEAPVQTFFRTVTRHVQLAGFDLETGCKVLMFLGSANRDPRRFEHADRYDITRTTGGHLGFGAGIHRCVGRMLAGIEALAAIDALVRHCDEIQPAGEPVRRLNNTIRGLQSLPLRLKGA